MNVLPPPLEPFGEYKQFIVYKLVPRAGATDKVPHDPYENENIDPHDPGRWMEFNAAASVANLFGSEYGVGFVFTDRDPFWFLDIDHCRVGDGWSDVANSLVQSLPGAAVEISQSGEGLHVFGSGTVGDHSTRNKPLGLEFYTSLRFVALTGNVGEQGSASVDLSNAINGIAQTYFPAPVGGSSVEEGWTDQPCAEWSGPEDDGELIARALRSGGGVAAGAFGAASGGRVTFADLWNRNVEALADKWPSETPGQAFDASYADSSMAAHLAFWTGKNCERVERLMRQSGLVRDKWDRRERGAGYLKTTIMKAVASCRDVYQQKQQAEPVTNGGGGQRFMSTTEQIEYFDRCAYVQDMNQVWSPKYGFMKSEVFKVMYGGYLFGLDTINEKTSDNAWKAFTENRGYDFPKVQSTCFRPGVEPGGIIEEEGWTLVNAYIPIDTPQQEGDPSRFFDYLGKLIPDDRDRSILISYMAAMVQYPGVKFQWCPIIQGAEGNGKSMIAKILQHAVGYRYTHQPNTEQLGDSGFKYNAWLAYKLLIIFEEIYVSDRREISEQMKVYITNDRIEVQGKGIDQRMVDNSPNFIAMTNHKNAVMIGIDTRRYAMFFTAQQSAEDIRLAGWGDRYFKEMYDWLNREGYAVLNHWLRNYQIPDEFNPATDCQRAPTTTSTSEAVTLSAGAIEQEIIEAIEQEVPGFKGGWISSLALDRLLDRLKVSHKLPRSRRRDVLKSLGYDWHPALGPQGRVNNKIMVENGKPKLYVKQGSPNLSITSNAGVVKAYMKAQDYGVDNSNQTSDPMVNRPA